MKSYLLHPALGTCLFSTGQRFSLLITNLGDLTNTGVWFLPQGYGTAPPRKLSSCILQAL